MAKKVKINYFVVDARIGRGIDRSLDRIKSRAIPFTFSTCLPSIFFLCSFLFFLPLSLSSPPLLFSFSVLSRPIPSILLFLDTVDDTQRKMITLFVVWGKRGGGEKGQGVGYLADKVLLSMPPRGKEGIYLDVEEKESAFRGFEGRVK